MAAIIASKALSARVAPAAALRKSSRSVVARAATVKVVARSAPFCPGAVAPEILDGSLAGDYGFDPLGFAKDPVLLQRYREAELMHSRWSMLAISGMLAVELLGYGSWSEAPKALLDGPNGFATYGAGQALFFTVIGWAEGKRSAETDSEKRCYPGGAFDPLGWSKGDDFAKLQAKEIANGRLAMLSIFGYFVQGPLTNAGPVANWVAHTSDPWHANVSQLF
mmetsp:Transcript_21024/g.29100  ORF Transcript_21024/g.29100 Transcript_21024/m.29100 type:complete len:222 (+) Transcript_21024:156-821(+)|eukprot:CAMPEP_0196598746 /NCGR_PEP_ID=MMETSP1081-20130531/94485_1 /TAXON_ID=36882 /ORGANISM="Pyramimonas amylifera, Strain CCMP720" /LENGTH=221 /DNA_ID=CAMNT_0041924465 /DNA_START=131 /DNA_END=796 /DNA_ORIENTATION=+